MPRHLELLRPRSRRGAQPQTRPHRRGAREFERRRLLPRMAGKREADHARAGHKPPRGPRRLAPPVPGPAGPGSDGPSSDGRDGRRGGGASLVGQWPHHRCGGRAVPGGYPGDQKHAYLQGVPPPAGLVSGAHDQAAGLRARPLGRHEDLRHRARGAGQGKSDQSEDHQQARDHHAQRHAQPGRPD